MRRPVEFVLPSQSVAVVARKMRDANVGFVPVCTADGRVIGVVTDRDLAVRVCAAERSDTRTEVAEVMSRDLVACRPTEDVSEAQELMARHQKSRLLVTDVQGRLLGVISLSDVAGSEQPLAAETLRAVALRELLNPRGRTSVDHVPEP
jgi:CBS domain-containing protein